MNSEQKAVDRWQEDRAKIAELGNEISRQRRIMAGLAAEKDSLQQHALALQKENGVLRETVQCERQARVAAQSLEGELVAISRENEDLQRQLKKAGDVVIDILTSGRGKSAHLWNREAS